MRGEQTGEPWFGVEHQTHAASVKSNTPYEIRIGNQVFGM